MSFGSGQAGSSGSEDDENSFQSILNQFKKVAEVSGLAGLFAKKGAVPSDDPNNKQAKEASRINHKSRVALS